jgi:N-acetylmuramoyl-L-alanine amidase
MRALAMSAAVVLVGAGLAVAPHAHAADLTGKVIVLDAGHGASAAAPLTSQVPNGRGGTKDCQTTGTSTNDGFGEHTFTWDVTTLISAQLEQLGATTVMTRNDDTGPAPCVDARAALANAQHPAAIVSIHGDGGPSSGHGFHVNYSSPPVNPVQSDLRLADTMRDALAASGLVPSTYIGSDGLYGRADLAGLNLAQYPAVLIELGNMRNVDDAARMTSPQGQAAYAAAVVAGIAAYLA